MISFEIRVNGSLIATVNCVNRGTTGKWDLKRGPECEYEWSSALFPSELNAAPTVQRGRLRHFRGDGALALGCDILTAISPKRCKRSRRGAPVTNSGSKEPQPG